MSSERPKCSKCVGESVITIQSSGHFCPQCFPLYFRQKYRRTLGAAKLIRHGDEVVFCFDGSRAAEVMLHVLNVLKREENDEPEVKRKGKRIRYNVKVLHLILPGQCSDGIEAKLAQNELLESRVEQVSPDQWEEAMRNVEKVERFGDETEAKFNHKKAVKFLLSERVKSYGGKLMLTCSTVESLAAETLTNVCLGMGHLIQSTASLDETFNHLTILRPFREMTTKEICFYVKNEKLKVWEVEEEEEKTKSVQSLASLFLSDLNAEGKGSNPTAIVKISNKIKPSS